MTGSSSIPSTFESLDYAVLGVYFVSVLAIGVWFARGEANTEEYLLGGRRVPWWAVAASFFVSVNSTLTMVGVPGEAYANGVTMAIGALVAPVAVVVTFFLFVRFYFRGKLFTPFAYLERRFDHRVRLFAAGIFSLTRLSYLALVLYSSAIVFEVAMGWDVSWTIVLVGVVGTLYTTLGGIRAVIWTDLLQFFVMAAGLLVIVIKLLTAVPGGAIGIIDYAVSHDHFMHHDNFWSFDPYVRLTFWLIFMGVFVDYLFFHSADQISLQRLLSTSSYAQARRSMFLLICLDLPMLLSMWFVGLGLWVFFQQQGAEARPANADHVLMHFVAGHLPSPMPGLILAALLAAIMSTLDSGINALATVFTKDFYLRYVRPTASERRQVACSRWITVLVGGFAIIVGIGISMISKKVKDHLMEVSAIWMATQSILPAIFLLAIFSRRIRAAQVLIAMTGGVGAVLLLNSGYLIAKARGIDTISPFYMSVAGTAVTLALGIMFSRFSVRRPPESLAGLTLWTWRAGESG